MEDPQSLFEPEGPLLNPAATALGPRRPDASIGRPTTTLLVEH
jgi:hypothetical protein